MSDGHASNTSARVSLAGVSAQARKPVRLSIRMRRWTLLTRIGDLPGINQARLQCGHSALGRSPEPAQTSAGVTAAGGESSAPPASEDWSRAGRRRRERTAAPPSGRPRTPDCCCRQNCRPKRRARANKAHRGLEGWARIMRATAPVVCLAAQYPMSNFQSVSWTAAAEPNVG